VGWAAQGAEPEDWELRERRARSTPLTRREADFPGLRTLPGSNFTAVPPCSAGLGVEEGRFASAQARKVTPDPKFPNAAKHASGARKRRPSPPRHGRRFRTVRAWPRPGSFPRDVDLPAAALCG
jgi:hypothetical protein